MNMRAGGFRFIDLPSAAERLGITRNTLLQWVGEGRIKPFTGSGQQSVFRAADVDRLAQELAATREAEEAAQIAQAEQAGRAEETASEGAPARQRRRDPVKLIGTRLSQDSRWAEITDLDIATYLDALEPVQFGRVRKVSSIAAERLQYLMDRLDEHEKRLGRAPDGGGG